MGACGTISYLVVLISIGLGLILFHGPHMPPLCAIFRLTCRPAAFGGHVDPGFEPIADVLRKHLMDGADVGASVAMYYKGKKVVDIYGGWRDLEAQRPYTGDVLQRVWSCSKAIESIVVGMLVDRKLLSYDDPIVKYWPEFGEHGKGHLTVGDLMMHKAIIFTDPNTPIYQPTEEQFRNPDQFAEYLAKQPIQWDRDATGYHCLVRGAYIAELLRRVDPKKRTVQQFIEDEITGPLGVEFYLGGPRGAKSFTRDSSRLARCIPTPMWQAILRLVPKFFLPEKLVLALGGDPHWPLSLLRASFNSTSMSRLACSSGVPPSQKLSPDTKDFDTPVFDLEIPSASGFSNAASLARIGAVMANKGSLDGVKLMSSATWEKATQRKPTVLDLVWSFPMNYTIGGFGYDQHYSGVGWIGWQGYGGSTILFNPMKNAAFSYVVNGLYGIHTDYRSSDFFRVINKLLSKLE